MSNYDESLWKDNQFSQDYRDDASIYLPFRKIFFEVANLFVHFFHDSKEIRVLDLGCGDGLFIQELLKSFDHIDNVTMVDGSEDMLAAAKERLIHHDGISYSRYSLQELVDNDPLNQKFDFIFSSLAIHHLNLEEKSSIYKYAYDHLEPSGHFLNYDIVLAPDSELENWYMSLWRKWIDERPDRERATKLLGIPDQYKANPDNIPDTLDDQLNTLKTIGFGNVDCFFKYGAFSLFGGIKPPGVSRWG